jgi:hypothetical protein
MSISRMLMLKFGGQERNAWPHIPAIIICRVCIVYSANDYGCYIRSGIAFLTPKSQCQHSWNRHYNITIYGGWNKIIYLILE